MIALSRLKQVEEADWIKDRRDKCSKCPLNTKNRGRLTLKEIAIKYLSDFYSFIMGTKEDDNLGNCSICGCSIFYSTQEASEQCSAKPPKWKIHKEPVKRKPRTKK